VLHFDRTVSLVQDFTSSRQKLGAALADLTTNPPGSRGGCHFRDGIQTASELMKRQTGRKAFILLSAGMERGSKISGEAAIEYAQRSDIIVYSIPFQGPTWPRLFVAVNAMGAKYKALGRQTLQQLALETGGGYFPVTPDKPLNEIYGQIEEELRSQYGIGYTPVQTKNNRTYRKLRLTTKNGDLVVQSRAGYYPK
jgi:VWFA-related protein